jgi:hypothetical protein
MDAYFLSTPRWRISVADNPDIRRSKLMGWAYSIITGGRSGNIQSVQTANLGIRDHPFHTLKLPPLYIRSAHFLFAQQRQRPTLAIWTLICFIIFIRRLVK